MWRKGYRAGRTRATKLFDEIFTIYHEAFTWRRAIHDEMTTFHYECEKCGRKWALDYYEEETHCPFCSSQYMIGKDTSKGAG